MQDWDPRGRGCFSYSAINHSSKAALTEGKSREGSMEQFLILDHLESWECALEWRSWGCVCQCGSWAALPHSFTCNWQLRAEQVKENVYKVIPPSPRINLLPK